MQYPFARKVESVIKKSVFEGRGFGAKMTVEQLIAKQTRIERYFCSNFSEREFQQHGAGRSQHKALSNGEGHMHCTWFRQLSTLCQAVSLS